jgi:hypothetical protein
MIAPTFSKESGGVAIISPSGEVILAIELANMSPFVMVLAP